MSKRTSRALSACAVAVTMAMITSCRATPSPAPTTVLLGDWRVTYGAPTTATITSSAGLYTLTAKTATVVTTASCTIRAGTVLGTFSGTSPNFTGQHGLWNTSTCAFSSYTKLTMTLNGDGSLTMRLGNGETHVLTKV